MNQKELQGFIMYYDRLTPHMLVEMTDYADIVLCINRERLINGILQFRVMNNVIAKSLSTPA